MRKTLVLGLGAAAIATWVLAPTAANACSRPVCSSFSAFYPTGTVPANLPALVWTEPSAAFQPVPIEQLMLTRQEAPIGFTSETAEGLTLIRPELPFAPADRFGGTLDDSSESCSGVSSELEFSDAVPLPEELGTIEVTSALGSIFGEQTTDGSCFSYQDGVRTRVQIQPTPEAEAWANAMVIQLLVDGQPYVDALDAWSGIQGGTGRTTFGNRWSPFRSTLLIGSACPSIRQDNSRRTIQ
ncbi:MAG: hypothetical protein AAGF12_43370, partial [Myxococcota bacterium]